MSSNESPRKRCQGSSLELAYEAEGETTSFRIVEIGLRYHYHPNHKVAEQTGGNLNKQGARISNST
jgi:hypothetical protein